MGESREGGDLELPGARSPHPLTRIMSIEEVQIAYLHRKTQSLSMSEWSTCRPGFSRTNKDLQAPL